VGNRYRMGLAAGVAFMAAGVLGCGGATALEYKDIAGKWCTTAAASSSTETI